MLTLMVKEQNKILKAAFDHTTSPKICQGIKQEILNHLHDQNEKQESEGMPVVSERQVEQFASQLCKLLEDESQKLAGHDKRVRVDS